MLGTPILALAISPVKAAAILLPILLVIDAISIFSHRRNVDWSIVISMLPAAILGITFGGLTATYVSDNWIRVLIGLIALVFAINQVAKDLLKRDSAKANPVGANIWGFLAGFTSFIAHAGGPPYQAYTVPLKMEKMLFVGTSVIFFSLMNAIKVIPYYALGQFSGENLLVSASLIPIAILGVLAGVWLVKRISQNFFYNFTYLGMVVIGTKLIWDGRAAFTSVF